MALEPGPHDGVAEQPALGHLLDGGAEPVDGKRVFGSDVDVGLVGPHGVRPDEHALEYRVRVALQDCPVHERAGVALVGVADDVLLVPGGVMAELPLEPGREPGAAAPAQAGPLDRVDDLLPAPS